MFFDITSVKCNTTHIVYFQQSLANFKTIFHINVSLLWKKVFLTSAILTMKSFMHQPTCNILVKTNLSSQIAYWGYFFNFTSSYAFFMDIMKEGPKTNIGFWNLSMAKNGKNKIKYGKVWNIMAGKVEKWRDTLQLVWKVCEMKAEIIDMIDSSKGNWIDHCINRLCLLTDALKEWLMEKGEETENSFRRKI